METRFGTLGPGLLPSVPSLSANHRRQVLMTFGTQSQRIARSEVDCTNSIGTIVVVADLPLKSLGRRHSSARPALIVRPLVVTMQLDRKVGRKKRT